MPNPLTNEPTKIAAISDKVAPMRPEPMPPLPKSLPASLRGEWRKLIQHLRDAGIWVPQRAGMVEAYLLNLTAIREAQAVMTRDGGILATGKVHPASAIISRHSGVLTKLGAQMGLGSPKASDMPNATKPATAPAKAKKAWTA